MTDALIDELNAVRQYQAHAPPNEACTCEWVILPLLWRAGYERHEIHSQVSDVARKYPDYTILPGTDHTWYLEAKEWRRDLQDDQDVVQATNYAYQNGRRWVVLSNGREWRLYDATIMAGGAGGRLVAVARLEQEAQLIELLHALSKQSVMSGRLERYVMRSRLSTTLREQLTASGSDIIGTIHSALRRRLGLPDVRREDLAEYFQALLAPGVAPPTEEAAAEESPAPARPTPGGLTLDDLLALRRDVERRRPERLTFPDGCSVAVSWWAELAVKVVGWFCDRSQLPTLPFRESKWGKHRYFLNSEPLHDEGQKMNSYHQFDVGGHAVYMDKNRSARGYIRALHALCREVGQDPAGLVVLLRE